eukprot:4716939-Prorocentrum_lima.AAC.1
MSMTLLLIGPVSKASVSLSERSSTRTLEKAGIGRAWKGAVGEDAAMMAVGIRGFAVDAAVGAMMPAGEEGILAADDTSN